MRRTVRSAGSGCSC